MCYSKIRISSIEDLSNLMNQRTQSFLQTFEKGPDQDDGTTTVNHLHQFASQSEIHISSIEDLRNLMNQRTQSFLQTFEKGPDQDDDSTTLNNLPPFPSQSENDINKHLMDPADAEYQKQNEDHAGNPISEKPKSRQKMKNFDSSSDEPKTEDTILEKALSIWESMLECIKNWWKKLLDFLKKTVAFLGRLQSL